VKNVIDFAHVERFAMSFSITQSAIRFAGARDWRAAGEQAVDADHVPALREKGITEMRSKKPAPPVTSARRPEKGRLMLSCHSSELRVRIGWHAARPTL